jgi:hypothetical protein
MKNPKINIIGTMRFIMCSFEKMKT